MRCSAPWKLAWVMANFVMLTFCAGCSRPPASTPQKQPKVVETPPKAFVKGVGLGLFATDPQYDYAHFLDEIIAHGATDLLVTVAWYQQDLRAHNMAPREGFSPDQETIEHTLLGAERRALRTTLMPIVRLIKRREKEWRGVIDPAAGVPAWFASYRQFVLPLAAAAEKVGVERFVVGSELLSLEGYDAQWRKLIAEVRQVFSGKVLYSANWDHFHQLSFWDAVDEMGVTGYFEVASPGSRPSVESVMGRWQKFFGDLRALKRQQNKRLILTEIGYPSRKSAGAFPWDETRASPLDMDLQALLYQAFCRSVVRSDHAIDGFYFWNWFGFGGEDDGGYTPRGKSAAKEMKRCFKMF